MNNGNKSTTLSLEIDKFLHEINYSSFYQKHIPNFKPNGTQTSCFCPFHEDKHKSFSINLETGLWNCFSGCGGGNAIQFIEKLYDLDFKDAVRKISLEEGIDNPLEKRNNGDSEKKKPTKKVSYLNSDQVEKIHLDLIQNEPLLKQFQEKYGFTLETIKEYRIGYKDGKYVIPLKISPGKWQIKLHKGIQTKGAKASIYPPDIIKENLPYIIITEGEFKALLLLQLGFFAVTNTAGALTWKKEWNFILRSLDVVIAYDNDEAGKKGAKKIAASLRGIAKSVKIIRWPSYMNGKDRKDVTDFFVTLKKTKEDFQKLIDNAKKIGYETKKIDGIEFIEPEDYSIEEQCVKYLSLFKDKIVENVIFYSPVIITSRAIDIDLGNEDIEIAFRRDWKWKKLWVNRKLLCDSRKIIDLSEQGLSVNSGNSRKMVEYLCIFENSNLPIIRKTYVTKGLGWKTVNDKKIFLLHKDETQSKSDNCINFVPEAGFERYVKAMKKEGSYEKWKAVIEEAITKYPLANFAFYASFAAPLLNILKAPNFIIDFWGTTSLGKTSVLELASSVWGNPHKESGGLVFSWDSTRVYLERMANFFCDIPIFPDDSQQVDDKTLAKILYMVANGVGRGRGSTTGVRHTATWQTVCFSTGEKPLTECTTFAGAKARTIEFHGSPFTTKVGSFINRLKHVIRENYGHAGSMFINHLVSLVSNPDEVEKLKAEYRKYQAKLAEIAQTEVGDRYSHYFAVVDLAARLANEVLGINNPDGRQNIFKVFMEFIGESAHDTDMAGRAMRHVLSWASGNERFFKNTDFESYGVWVEGEYIAIYPHKLKEVLKMETFSEKAVMKEWANRQWIKRHDKHYAIMVTIHNSPEIKQRRMVTIPWKVIEKFNE